MRVLMENDGILIEDADNFRALSIESRVPPDALRELLNESGLGILDEDLAHVWLEPDVLAATSGRGDDAEWKGAFAQMCAYAVRKGWADDRGRIRAHID